MKQPATGGRRHGDLQLAWKQEQVRCQLCEERTCTDVHEIARGPARKRCRQSRYCVLLLCRTCHNLVQNWPIAHQLAIKLTRDIRWFDHRFVNLVRGRQADAITYDEIDLAAEQLGLWPEEID